MDALGEEQVPRVEEAKSTPIRGQTGIHPALYMTYSTGVRSVTQLVFLQKLQTGEGYDVSS